MGRLSAGATKATVLWFWRSVEPSRSLLELTRGFRTKGLQSRYCQSTLSTATLPALFVSLINMTSTKSGIPMRRMDSLSMAPMSVLHPSLSVDDADKGQVWEFKHPEFKMNGKDSLENIRRKAPATRKSLQNSDDLPPTQQIDMVNGQLVAMQQQLQQLSDRYNDLSAHHALLLSELMGLQKTVVNHENVMQNVMTYLHTADSFIRDQQRNSRVRTAFAGVPEGEAVSTEMNPPAKHISPVGTTLPSPLQNADKLLHDSSTETLLNNKTLEQMNELYKQMNGAANTPSPRTIISGHGAGLASQRAPAGPEGGLALDYTKLNCDFQDAVYPAGHNNGIDPLFSEHINNIPYSMPTGKDISPTDPRKQFSESRKKSSTIDPGWIRRPQILLVEDDPTCRRIGGKFLYSFKCAIDSAVCALSACSVCDV